MATLPTPGGDVGSWGDELNTFLRVSHLEDGNLRVADSQVLSFGSTLDVSLYRSTANALKTDDSFDAALLRIAGVDIDTIYSKITDLAAHVAAADPHTGYQRESEKGFANGYASLDASSLVPDTQIPPSIARDAEVTAAIATHAGLADPHTGYQRETEKGAANGYASLDGSGFVPDAQIPAAIARDTEITSAISTHAAAADPHTGYQKESEKGVASGYASLDSGGLVPVAQLPASGGATVGTTLPTSPVDQQEAILVDSLTAPTYAWRFKYLTGISGANKWLFIGGSPKWAAFGTASGSAVSLAWQDVGDMYTFPRAGIYHVELHAASGGQGSPTTSYLAAGINAQTLIIQAANFTTGAPFVVSNDMTVAAVDGNQNVIDLYIQDTDDTRRMSFYNIAVRVTPVRVA